MNKCIIIGRVGKDPEARTVGENKVVSLTVATSKKWKNKAGEKQESTQWHTVKAWDKLATIIESYVKKGSMIMIEGEINYRKHEEKYYTEIVAYNIEILSKAEPKEEKQPETKSDNDEFFKGVADGLNEVDF